MGEEMLFHTTLRNTGLFITLSFACLTYAHSFPKLYIRRLILSLGLIFLSISFMLNLQNMKLKDENIITLQKIPKLLFVVQMILTIYVINMLVFKKMK